MLKVFSNNPHQVCNAVIITTLTIHRYSNRFLLLDDLPRLVMKLDVQAQVIIPFTVFVQILDPQGNVGFFEVEPVTVPHVDDCSFFGEGDQGDPGATRFSV